MKFVLIDTSKPFENYKNGTQLLAKVTDSALQLLYLKMSSPNKMFVNVLFNGHK